jgi:hypothetical protein
MKFEVEYNGDREVLNIQNTLGIFVSRYRTQYSLEVIREIVTQFHNLYIFYITASAFERLNLHNSAGKFVLIYDSENWHRRKSFNSILNIKVNYNDSFDKKTQYLFLDLFVAQKVRNILILEATQYSKNLEIIGTYCAERGLNVFCLPGKITEPTSVGTNRMIFNGAIPLYTLDLLNV